MTDTGLMDPTVIMYHPAILIHYNRHRLNRVFISGTMADGIEILRNDAYSNCRLSYSDISHNMGTRFFLICTLSMVGSKGKFIMLVKVWYMMKFYVLDKRTLSLV